jgi:hypothetical protein
MTNNLRDLFAEDISDEAAYYLGNFLYELALAFESAHLGQIKRYNKSRIELYKELMNQNRAQSVNGEKELQELP